MIRRARRGRFSRGIARAGAGVLFAGIVLIGLPGCGLLRLAYQPDPYRPQRAPVPEAPDSTESIRIVVFPSLPPEFLNESPSAKPPAATHRDTVAVSPTVVPPAPAVRDSAASPPFVSVDIPEKERADLAARTREDIREAEAILSGLEAGADRERLRERIETVRGLIQQSRAAGDRRDARAAATLAHKARLLATEMAGR